MPEFEVKDLFTSAAEERRSPDLRRPAVLVRGRGAQVFQHEGKRRESRRRDICVTT
jgi:hypothetical protein